MHMQEVLRPGLFVQIVDVLRHHQHLTRPFPLQTRQRQMGGVGTNVTVDHGLTAHVVKLKDPLWIAGVGLRRGYILNAGARPQAPLIAKGFQPRFL